MKQILKQLIHDKQYIKKMPVIRHILGEIVLCALAIAYVADHLDGLTYKTQILFSTIFVGLVLYFKTQV